MAMSVLYSSSSMSALGDLNKNSKALAKDLKKVSTSMRVNGAGDDAAGYSIVLQQAAQSMLAQANQNLSAVLGLLQ